jgi:actin beta/gamma 1
MTERKAVVVDTGSGTTKAGFAGADAPCSIIPSVVGLKRRLLNLYPIMPGIREYYVGHEARERRGLLTLRCPVEHGIVSNWDNMEKLLHDMFYDNLNVSPEEHHTMVTEAPLNSTENQHKMNQLMFETFRVPALSVQHHPVLALHASGRSTGIVLDSGLSKTNIVPIHEGQVIKENVLDLDVAGENMTNRLYTIIIDRGYSITTSAELDMLRDVKEKLCYVALDFDKEMCRASCDAELEGVYELPDGCSITLNNERFRATEPIFEPNSIGLEQPGVHELIFNSINKCDVDIRDHLYRNVVLSGGTTMLNGMQERLVKELVALAPLQQVDVIKPVDKYSVWLGGSMLASLSTFQQYWIQKQEYDEVGPSVTEGRKRF